MSRLLVTALILLGVLAPAAASAAAAPVWQQQAMVPVIASVDGTAALQAGIDATPDGGTLTLEAGASYRIDGTLLIRDRNGFTLDGNGATIYAITEGDRVRQHLSIANGSNIKVANLTVLGANPYAGTSDAAYRSTREAQHAFQVLGTDTVELDRVRAYDVFGDHVYIGMSYAGLTPANVWVHDSTFARNGRMGVGLTAGRNVVFERNSISAIRRSTFDLEPNNMSQVVDGLVIRDNVIGTGRFFFLASVGNGPVNNVTVENNVFRGKAMKVFVQPPSYTGRRTGWTMTGNTSDAIYGGSTASAVFGFFGVDNITVTGNYQKVQVNRSIVGVNTHDGCGVTVSGNQFPNAVAELAPTAGC